MYIDKIDVPRIANLEMRSDAEDLCRTQVRNPACTVLYNQQLPRYGVGNVRWHAKCTLTRGRCGECKGVDHPGDFMVDRPC